MTYGPIDFLAIELQTDQLTGEGMSALLELVENQIVRIIDLVIIMKDHGGEYQVLEIEELEPDVLVVIDPLDVEVSGIIQMEDIELIGEAMENNTTAALMLYENLWAIKFAEAVTRSGGRMLMYDRIPYEIVNEMMELFEEAEA